MKTIILIALTLVIFSCGRKGINPINGTSTIKVIDLLSEPESEITNLSDIATDVEYIPLQTMEKSLIRYVYEMKVTGSKIYIQSSNEIICFDSIGHYLYKLSKVGKGPGEYIFINHFDINSKSDLLIFNSGWNISVFNIRGNEFIFNKSLNFKEDIYNEITNINFIPGQNNILVSYSYNGTEPLRNLLINLNGDTLYTRPNYIKFVHNTKHSVSMGDINFIYNNSIHFKEWLSDTLFIFDQSNKIIPYLILNSNGKQLTPDAFAKFLNSPPRADFGRRGSTPFATYLVVTSVMEIPRYLYYRFNYMNTRHDGFYDKVLNKKYGIDSKKFLEDDITGGVNFEPKFCFDGKLYSWVEAMELKKHISDDSFKKTVVKNPEKKKALEKMAISLNETDNPVLIIVTPKK